MKLFWEGERARGDYYKSFPDQDHGKCSSSTAAAAAAAAI